MAETGAEVFSMSISVSSSKSGRGSKNNIKVLLEPLTIGKLKKETR